MSKKLYQREKYWTSRRTDPYIEQRWVLKRNENLSSHNLKFSLVHVGIKIDDDGDDDDDDIIK